MKNNLTCYFPLLCFFLLATGALSAQVWYVNATSPCRNNCDGSTWDKALTDLQVALTRAKAGGEIRVAAGVYHPHPTDRSVSFVIPEGVQLLGGFSDDPGTQDIRDVQLYSSVLSGDLQENDAPGFLHYEDNSYTVVLTEKVSANTLIEGFVISGGNANHPDAGKLRERNGGGWFNTQYKGTSSPVIRQCIFRDNQAIAAGGAFFNGGLEGVISPTFVECIFENNRAVGGGAVYNSANTNRCEARWLNCTFRKNEAVNLNTAVSGTGGSVYNFASHNGICLPEYRNCIFQENRAGSAGAFYSLADGSLGAAEVAARLVNCTFYGNYAQVGGAVYVNASHNGQTVTTVDNSIFWNSRGAHDRFFHFSTTSGGDPQIHLRFCLFDAGGKSELYAGPANRLRCTYGRFYRNSNAAMFIDPQAGNFHLLPNAPSVNAGSNELVLDQADFDGDQRIVGPAVDLGADEATQLWLDRLHVVKTPASGPLLFPDLRSAAITDQRSVRLRLYPNPVANTGLQISEIPEAWQDKTFIILDLQGRPCGEGILSWPVTTIGPEQLAALPAATYLLQITGVSVPFRFEKLAGL